MKKSAILISLLILNFFFFGGANAQTTEIDSLENLLQKQTIPTYDISANNISLNDFTVGLITDASLKLHIDDIAKMQDSCKLVNSRFAIKSIRTPYWYILKLKNSSPNKVERIIGLDETFFETVDIYYKTNMEWDSSQSGLSIPMHEREIKNRCPLFNVSFEPDETKTIYLKAYSKVALVSGITVEDVPVFLQNEQRRTMGYWGYFGAAISIVLYNLFLLFYIRERVYLFYVVYAICFVFFTFSYSGFLQHLMVPPYSVNASIALTGAFVSLFTRELLNIKNISRWIDRTLLSISAVYTVIAILIVVDIYFYKFLVLFGMPSMLFLLFAGIYSLFKKTPIAKYYVVAMSFYLIGLAMIGTVNLGLIPYNFLTRYSFMIGSIIELLVFSLALGYRVKLLQDEKNTYHIKLLVSERGIKEKLELQVAERTEELILTLEELHSTNDKLLELDQFKEGMTSMIVHDLKNPLNTIINIPQSFSFEKQNANMKQSGKQMLNMVLNILDVHKYEEIKMTVNKIDHSLFELSQNAIKEVYFLAEQKSIAITNNIAPQLGVKCDKEVTERVFVNLLTNAIKYTLNNGAITLSADWSNCMSGLVKVQVTDTGQGISKDKLSSVFDKFGQVSAKKSGGVRSTGLGLTFCKMAVEAHGGEISVESEIENLTVGKVGGTSFIFTLPLGTEFKKVEANEKIVQSKPKLILSDKDKKLLKPYVKELSTFMVYQTSSVKKILDSIDCKENEFVENWITEVHDSLFALNEDRFNNLINQIS